jgi:hypothetical protein
VNLVCVFLILLGFDSIDVAVHRLKGGFFPCALPANLAWALVLAGFAFGFGFNLVGVWKFRSDVDSRRLFSVWCSLHCLLLVALIYDIAVRKVP